MAQPRLAPPSPPHPRRPPSAQGGGLLQVVRRRQLHPWVLPRQHRLSAQRTPLGRPRQLHPLLRPRRLHPLAQAVLTALSRRPRQRFRLRLLAQPVLPALQAQFARNRPSPLEVRSAPQVRARPSLPAARAVRRRRCLLLALAARQDRVDPAVLAARLGRPRLLVPAARQRPYRPSDPAV